MIIFVLNCGSSSIKYKIYKMPEGKTLISGGVTRIGYEDAKFTFEAETKTERIQPISDHEQGINLILKTIEEQQKNTGVRLCDIDAAGHRVVQGGSEMNVSRIIDEEIIDYIESIAHLAPLHNPNHLKGIRAVGKLLPDLPQVAVFDNGYHTTIPEHVYTYGLNYEIAQRLQIRKYGFHGIAFRSMIEKAAKLLGEDLSGKKIVNMMLGSGTTAKRHPIWQVVRGQHRLHAAGRAYSVFPGGRHGHSRSTVYDERRQPDYIPSRRYTKQAKRMERNERQRA